MPPPFLLTPRVLAQAPELGVLAMLEEAMHLALLTLIAEHPSLENGDHWLDGGPDAVAITLRLATRIVDRLQKMERLLGRYRDAVQDGLATQAMPDDDIPF